MASVRGIRVAPFRIRPNFRASPSAEVSVSAGLADFAPNMYDVRFAQRHLKDGVLVLYRHLELSRGRASTPTSSPPASTGSRRCALRPSRPWRPRAAPCISRCSRSATWRRSFRTTIPASVSLSVATPNWRPSARASAANSSPRPRKSAPRFRRRRCANALRCAARIGLKVGAVLDRRHMAKHFELAIADTSFAFARKTEAIAFEAALDGVCVIRSSLRGAPHDRSDAPSLSRRSPVPRSRAPASS